MKLDETTGDQRLSLDVPPLIDVVFLLVLFFAVTTSFISPEDLRALRTDLLGLAQDKEQLSAVRTRLTRERDVLTSQVARNEERIEQQQGEIVRLEDQYASLNQDYEATVAANRQRIESLRASINEADARRAKSEWMVSALEQQQLDLQKRLNERNQKVESIEAQLAKAYEDYQSLNVDISLLREQNTTLAGSEEALRARVVELELENAKYKEVADLDREQVERLLKAQQDLRQGLGDYFRDNQLGLVREKQRLVLQLSNQILFDSGSATIKPGGLSVLEEVGAILKERVGELDVQIGGHTDNVPIPSDARGPYRSNWGLSAARAVNVVTFLESKVGIDPKKLAAIGFGEFRPVSSNETVEGRAKNRRIEIVLLPN